MGSGGRGKGLDFFFRKSGWQIIFFFFFPPLAACKLDVSFSPLWTLKICIFILFDTMIA